MHVPEAVRARRMVRAYDPARPISRETLDDLLRLALAAPSAGHTQGREFLVLDDITLLSTFWEATASESPNGWLQRMRTAPALVIIFADRAAYLDRYAEPDKGSTPPDDQQWPVPYWDVDAGMAAMILLLAATHLGLGACFFGVPGQRWGALRDAFDVPERLRPVGVVSLGYAAADLRSPSLRRGTRPFGDVVHHGRYKRV